MGQKEKARAIVSERYEITVRTKMANDQWIKASRNASEASKSMLKGKVVEDEVELYDDGDIVAIHRLVGPGAVATIMTFAISGVPQADGGTEVSIDVGDFLFQKGSLGMKPTINGSKVMDKFLDVFTTELAAG